MEAVSGNNKLEEFYSAGITCGFEPAANYTLKAINLFMVSNIL